MTAAEIAAALGLRRAGSEWHGPCPACGYRSGFAVAEGRDGAPLVCCHAGGCSQLDVIEACPAEIGAWSQDREPTVRWPQQQRGVAPAVVAPSKEDAALALWRRSQPLSGTVGEVYLRSRGYIGPIPAVLRFGFGRHPSDPSNRYPMMVAAVVLEGRMDRGTGIHRTFLRPDGLGKASLDPNKMTLAIVKGAAVPLAPAGPILAVAEGIETALSYMLLTGAPTWSALSAGGIRNLILPPEVKEVIIAADPDIVGLRAAREAARRWLAEGRCVRISTPPARSDFNDLLRAG